MDPSILLHAAASALYAGLAFYFWRTRWRGVSRNPGAVAAFRLERIAILLPILVHALVLYRAVLLPAELRLGFAVALSAMMLLAALFYWMESFFYDLDGLQPPMLLLAAIAVLLPMLFGGRPVGIHGLSFEFRIHLVLAVIAYSFLTLAVAHAGLMAALERKLHNAPHAAGHASGDRMFEGVLAGLPPLLTLERLLFRLIGVSFILLTLTLATGMTLSDSLFGRALRFNHETVFALTAWAAFAVLLVGRHFYGWRGRTALRWTIAGFMLVILANIGTAFVLEVVLQRT